MNFNRNDYYVHLLVFSEVCRASISCEIIARHVPIAEIVNQHFQQMLQPRCRKDNSIAAAADRRFLLSLSSGTRGESVHGFFDYPARSHAAEFSRGMTPSNPVQSSQRRQSD